MSNDFKNIEETGAEQEETGEVVYDRNANKGQRDEARLEKLLTMLSEERSPAVVSEESAREVSIDLDAMVGRVLSSEPGEVVDEQIKMSAVMDAMETYGVGTFLSELFRLGTKEQRLVGADVEGEDAIYRKQQDMFNRLHGALMAHISSYDYEEEVGDFRRAMELMGEFNDQYRAFISARRAAAGLPYGFVRPKGVAAQVVRKYLNEAPASLTQGEEKLRKSLTEQEVRKLMSGE